VDAWRRSSEWANDEMGHPLTKFHLIL
jgi:hypothetical protein